MPTSSSDTPNPLPIADPRTRAEATSWFEPLYAAAARGETNVPWDRGAPHWLLVRWAGQRDIAANGERVVVIGCGTGDDAEYIASHGYQVTAFDISPSAVQAARRRYPDSPVEYVVADLFDPPAGWHRSFDLVIESQTVQALPASIRHNAIMAVTSLVAAGGTLVVLAAGVETDTGRGHPPWPLTRNDIDRFADTGLTSAGVEAVPEPGQPGTFRWCAEFHRPPDHPGQ